MSRAPALETGFLPYDHSVVWGIHDAYFATRGIAAWTEGDIPHAATTSYAAARDQARFFVGLVEELERTGALDPAAPVFVLEIGAGLGQLAAHFLRALARGTGPAGRALATRVRYLVSDYVDDTVRQACATPALRDHVAAGRAIPACFDVRAPGELRTLAGAPIDAPIAFVLASYVCCVSPLRVLRKTAAGYAELAIRVAAPAPRLDALGIERAWIAAELETLAPDPIHARAIANVARDLETATIPYPQQFLDAVRALLDRVVRGGAIAVVDFGTATRAALRGLRDHAPRYYGNSVNHGVAFAVFDAFARAADLALVRTHDPFRALHTAMFRAVPFGQTLARAFHQIFTGEAEGELVVALRAAVREHWERCDYAAVARASRRLVDLDPTDPQARYWLGFAAIQLGEPALALVQLARGRELAPDDLRFELERGRALHALGRVDDAVATLRDANARRETPLGFAYVASAHWDRGEHQAAHAAIRVARALDADHVVARHVHAEIERAWMARLTDDDPQEVPHG